MNRGTPELGGYIDGCGCASCIEVGLQRQLDEDGQFGRYLTSHFMVFCPDCGNKRCPKATHHSHACTGSNDSGQPGSTY